MDYKELLKKYWFIGAVGILLIIFVIAWSVDDSANKTEKETIQTKQVDGKYSLFEIDGKAYTADEFYDFIDTSTSLQIAVEDLMGIIADKEIKTTEEIKALAANNAQYLVMNYSEEELEQLMRQNGLKKYGNITSYYESLIRKQELFKKYLTDHTEDIVAPYASESKYKKISHILIKVADVTETTDDEGNTTHTANPTDEEKAKLDEALEALKTESFADVAKKYSDDGSASTGGYLGCLTDDAAANTYVKEFADCVASLEYGETSDVITTTYGYHIILVEEPSNEELIEDQTFLSEIISQNNNEYYFKLLIEYCDKYNIEIVSEDMIELFDQYKDIEETDVDETTESATESEVSE